MGDHEGWMQPSGLVPNGLLPNEAANVTRVLDAERWAKAEERTEELIKLIQPNKPSEKRRDAVANYVRRLIRQCFSCEVFTFGSVPLKTYLPDGDIDLTAFTMNENLKDTWALEVRDMLEKEEKSENAEFRVKEVQYIQAEVKIVKCLVENIVVDISFNQVGGLCTLCFLEEIDHLINQEYLFKRSIILIKAWCYYESRILGAHHGLISTYALETLVLYIFHVFNNSFSGPLEVLYRFLEFFSNFDWENFCVSLWGPVPISSLPDTTAQPPRKDGGELLLSQLFLGACSTVYAVMQPGQENQSQAFISKHFNVIDPLRTNNNLGRSVSKGNFFRIRSAFAFGAKRLARLLECPKEDLITELNQFFMNTWERHGSGNRPDAPSSDLCVARPLKTTAVEGANNIKTTINKKKSDNPGLRVSLEHQAESGLTFQGSAAPISNNLSQHSRNMYKTATQAAITHPNSQKHYGNHINNRGSDQFERNNNSISSIRSDKNQKYLRSDHYVDDEEVQGRFQFARTQSSPELSETSAAVGFQGKHNKLIETNKELASSARVELATRRKNYSPEASGVHSSVTSFDDPTLLGHISSRQWFQPTAELNHVPNIPHEDAGLAKIGDLDSLSEKLEMQQEMNQEEQDLINMMTSSGMHNFGGQVQFPLQLASSHVHFPLSPVLASIGYAQRNTPGMFPANVPLVEPSWGSNLQFSQGHVSLPLSHYAPTVGGFPNADDFIDSVNENSGMIKGNLEGNGDPFWHEHDAKSSRPFSHGNGGINMCDDDESQQSTSGRSSVVSLSLADNYSTSLVHGQHRFSREDGELAREDYADGIQYPLSRVNDIYSTERTTSLRYSPISQSGSVITRLASESSKDGPGMKASKSGRDKWGRKPASSAGMTSSYGKQKSSWHSRGPYNVSAEEDDHHKDWLRPSSDGDDISDRATTESVSPVTPHSSAHQSHGYESASVSGSDSMIPIGQVVIGGSRQGSTDHPAVVPLTFFPTGPPVPFLTMLPVYNFQHNSGTSDGSTSQFDRDDGEDHGHINPSDQDLDSPSDVDRSGVHMLAASKASAVEPSEEHKSDILNSDFASHWQNLQYGRSCQSTYLHGPLVYPPVMVPPVYLQGHFPLEAPGRPHSTNANLFTQIMSYGPRLVPLTPLQRGPLRPSVFNRFGDAPPRFRGGTGTYLPNPKVSFRDRQPSNARNHRGNFNHDRSDLRDREGSWVNSKRAASRNHGRYQAERLSSRLDPLSLTENRTDRSVDSFRSEPDALCESQNTTFQSRSTSQSFANLPNSVYALPSASSNGVGPTMPAVHSVVMLYPYDQGASYVSPPESLEFGSLGPVQLSALSERTQPSSANSVRGVNEQKHSMHRGGSPRSSTDNPSSSLVQRSVDERKYDLKAEDFPPLSFPNQGGGGGGNNYKRKPSHISFLSSPHS